MDAGTHSRKRWGRMDGHKEEMRMDMREDGCEEDVRMDVRKRQRTEGGRWVGGEAGGLRYLGEGQPQGDASQQQQVVVDPTAQGVDTAAGVDDGTGLQVATGLHAPSALGVHHGLGGIKLTGLGQGGVPAFFRGGEQELRCPLPLNRWCPQPIIPPPLGPLNPPSPNKGQYLSGKGRR